jgi:hypothetical protein
MADLVDHHMVSMDLIVQSLVHQARTGRDRRPQESLLDGNPRN